MPLWTPARLPTVLSEAQIYTDYDSGSETGDSQQRQHQQRQRQRQKQQQQQRQRQRQRQRRWSLRLDSHSLADRAHSEDGQRQESRCEQKAYDTIRVPDSAAPSSVRAVRVCARTKRVSRRRMLRVPAELLLLLLVVVVVAHGAVALFAARVMHTHSVRVGVHVDTCAHARERVCICNIHVHDAYCTRTCVPLRSLKRARFVLSSLSKLFQMLRHF